MSLRLLLALSGSLEILAGLLAPIQPAPVVSFQFEVPAVWIAAVLTRPFSAGGVHAGATCMKACGDVQSPAGRQGASGSQPEGTGSRGYYLDSNRVGPERPVAVKNRNCPYGFRRVILGRPRGNETITERSVGRSTWRCV